jgi:hypothetical protein
MRLDAHVLEALVIMTGVSLNCLMVGIMKMIDYIPIQENLKTEKYMELKLKFLTGKLVTKLKDQYFSLLKTEMFAKLLIMIITSMFMTLYLDKM